jgi:hypothetical protein
MFQLAASLLFVTACGFALSVILMMLRNNGAAIMSALTGHGAFADQIIPVSKTKHKMFKPRRAVMAASSYEARRPRDISRAAA